MAIKKRSTTFTEQAMVDEPNESISSLPEFGSGMMTAPKRGFNWLPLSIVVIILIIAGGLYFVGMNAKWWGGSSMKAVFLVNGQVYFGHIVRETSRDLYINNVYYIQLQDQVQPATAEGEQAQTIQVPTLLKRGEELHRPYGEMRLNRDQIVAIENVGSDSPIYQQIQQLGTPKK